MRLRLQENSRKSSGNRKPRFLSYHTPLCQHPSISRVYSEGVRVFSSPVLQGERGYWLR